MVLSARSFVVAMNRVDDVALNTIFALRLSKTGRTVGRTGSRWMDGRAEGRPIGRAARNDQQQAAPLDAAATAAPQQEAATD